MSTSGDFEWAVKEAFCRSGIFHCSYTIYCNMRQPDDHIIRRADVAGPDHPWKVVCTVTVPQEDA